MNEPLFLKFVQDNFFSIHPESLLLAMISDPNRIIRNRGTKKILFIRYKKRRMKDKNRLNSKDMTVRTFKQPTAIDAPIPHRHGQLLIQPFDVLKFVVLNFSATISTRARIIACETGSGMHLLLGFRIDTNQLYTTVSSSG